MREPEGPIATDLAIKSLAPPDRGQKIYYDGTIPGFGVRVTAAGAKTFILNYRVRGTAKERRFSIGRTADWKVKIAREEARRLRKIVDLGGDPVGDEEQQRADAAAERIRSKTVSDLCDRFRDEHFPSLRPATRAFYKSALKNHIEPAIGKKRVEDVRRGDVEKIYTSLTELGQRHQANQCVTLTGVLFKLAAKWGWRTGENPARQIDKHTLEGRERYLTSAETKRLSEALEMLEDRQAARIIRVLMLTGARVGETFRMRWEQVDFQKGMWTKPAATTKQKKIHRLPLTAPVLAILADIKREQDNERELSPRLREWIFPGRSKSGHRNDIRRPWETALKAAKIANLRIHDLRHSFASSLVGAGYSLPMIGAALGHTRVETTQRYAHLADDPLREAMTRAADLIEAAAKDEPATVLHFPSKQ